jgi:hypothetical protein
MCKVFQPLVNTVNHLNAEIAKPAISTQSKGFIRVVAPIANAGKAAVVALAYLIAVPAAIIFSLLSYPVRAYQFKKAMNVSIETDLKRLTPAEDAALDTEIRAYIEKKSAKGLKIDASRLDACVEKTKASYARSQEVYGAVAVKWVESLFEHAEKTGQKLVFIARDGAAPFALAQNMMKTEKYQNKFPGMAQEGRILMGYFSRAIVNSSYATPEGQDRFKKYLKDEVGVQPGDKCLLVDVGFAGSMVDKVREMAGDPRTLEAVAPYTRNIEVNAANPGSHVEFEYLMSTGTEPSNFSLEKASGFLSSVTNRISALPGNAGGLPGTWWIEDTHQGVIDSPKTLVEHTDGHIYPDTIVPGQKKTCMNLDGNGEEYVVRRFSKKAIADAYLKADDAVSFETLRAKFNDTLLKLTALELPRFVEHRK